MKIPEPRVVGNVTVTALYLQSIKAMVKLKEPVRAEIVYIVEPRLDGKGTFDRYELKAEGVGGYWYPPDRQWDSFTEVPKRDHRNLLEGEPLQTLITSGLVALRTTLKHVHGSGLLHLVGKVVPADKKNKEYFTTEWV